MIKQPTQNIGTITPFPAEDYRKKTAETRQCVAEVPSVVATAALRAQRKEAKRDT